MLLDLQFAAQNEVESVGYWTVSDAVTDRLTCPKGSLEVCVLQADRGAAGTTPAGTVSHRSGTSNEES